MHAWYTSTFVYVNVYQYVLRMRSFYVSYKILFKNVLAPENYFICKLIQRAYHVRPKTKHGFNGTSVFNKTKFLEKQLLLKIKLLSP